LAIAVARGDLTTRVVSKVIGAGVLMSPSPPEMSADSMLLKRMQRNVSGKRRGGLRTGLSTAPAKKLQRHDSAELSRQRPGRTIVVRRLELARSSSGQPGGCDLRRSVREKVEGFGNQSQRHPS
jgi:hypothetical protein